MTAVACRPRDNPFRTERLDRLGYRDAATGTPAGDADLGALVERFERLGRRAAVIGPEGSGKTTLLDALEPWIAVRGFLVHRLRASPDGGVHPDGVGEVGPRTLLMVDGLDRLPRSARRRIRRTARGAAGLLATAHRRLRIPTLVECSTTPALLATLVSELTAERPAGTGGQPSLRPEPAAPLPAAEALHARHRGNLRTALLELYDLCAGR